MTGGEDTGGPRGGRLGALGRRYYPIGIAGAFLATVVGFFPSTVPLGAAGPLWFGGTGSSPGPVAATGPAVAAPAPAAAPQPALAGGFGDLFPVGPISPEVPATASPPPAGGSLPPPASCPLPIPTTGTPLDSLLYEVISLCELLTGAQGTLPSVPSLLGIPGAPSAPPVPPAPVPSGPAAPARAGPPVFVAADDGLAAAPPAVPAPVVVLGLVQNAAVPAALPGALARLHQDGAQPVVLLIPAPGATGAAAAFAAWVSRTVGALPGAAEVAIGLAAPSGLMAASAVAADALSGLQAAWRAAAPGTGVGLWWGDGGTAPADAPVWQALVAQSGSGAAGALREASFVAGTLVVPAPSGAGCAAVAAAAAVSDAGATALRGALARVPALAATRLVLEMAGAGLPSPVPPAGCALTPPSGAGPVSSLLWRLGAGPVVPAGR